MTKRLPKLAEFESVMEAAADIARRHAERLRDSRPEARLKADSSPVTAADLEIAAFLQESLLALTPGANWLCEEGPAVEREANELIWVVDPLDGTKEFLRGLPEFSISVALLDHLRPVLAAVVNPMTGEAGVWSDAGGLRFKGNVAPPAALGGSRLEEAAANVSRTEYEKGSLEEFRKGLKEIRPIGSVAYKLLRVAAGAEDLYFSVEPKSEWDLCGGAALLSAAGLTYVTFDGLPMTFTGTNRRIESGAVAGSASLVQDFLVHFAAPIHESQDRIARKLVR